MVSVFKSECNWPLRKAVAKQGIESAIYLHSINCSSSSKGERPVKTSPSCYLATAMAGKRDVGGKERGLGDENPKKPVKPEDEKT